MKPGWPEVVKFPLRARLSQQFRLGSGSLTEAVDLELRQVDTAIKTLAARKRVLLELYKQMMQAGRNGALGALIYLPCNAVLLKVAIIAMMCRR